MSHQQVSETRPLPPIHASTSNIVRNVRASLRASAVKRLLVLLGSMAVASFLLACSEVPSPTATPVMFEPTPAQSGTRALVLAGGADVNISALTAPRELPDGDAGDGEALYNTLGCSACHMLSDEVLIGPGFRGIYARVAGRTELSADEYIVESLTKPSAFIVDGFTNAMQSYDYLSDQELADLIEFLKTIQ